MKLTTTQFDWLQWLHRNGGIAVMHGHRLMANGEETSVGSAVCFLKLVCVGAVAPQNNRLVITDYGRRLLAP
jgi:hypothetical protein